MHQSEWIVIPDKSSVMNYALMTVTHILTGVISWWISEWYHASKVVERDLTWWNMGFISVLVFAVTLCTRMMPDPYYYWTDWYEKDYPSERSTESRYNEFTLGDTLSENMRDVYRWKKDREIEPRAVVPPLPDSDPPQSGSDVERVCEQCTLRKVAHSRKWYAVTGSNRARP